MKRLSSYLPVCYEFQYYIPLSTYFSKILLNIYLSKVYNFYRLYPSYLDYQLFCNIETLDLYKGPSMLTSLERMILVPGSVRGRIIKVGSGGEGRKDRGGRKDTRKQRRMWSYV